MLCWWAWWPLCVDFVFLMWCSLFPLLGARVGSPLFVAGLASISFRHVLRPRYFWRVLFILVFGRA
jgi:hypothetical protein